MPERVADRVKKADPAEYANCVTANNFTRWGNHRNEQNTEITRASEKESKPCRRIGKPVFFNVILAHWHCTIATTLDNKPTVGFNPLRTNYCHTWHMENQSFLWRWIRRIRRIQVSMACKGLTLQYDMPDLNTSWRLSFGYILALNR